MNKLINSTQVKGIVMRNIYEWRRNLDRVVDSFWWATIDLVFWGLTANYLKQTSSTIPHIVYLFIGGIVLWVIVQNSQRDINMPLLNDAWNRNLINLFTTPIRLREFILGTIILGLIKLTMTVILLVVLAYLLYQFNIFTFGLYLIPAVINLILVGWSIGFFINGLILRFGYRIESFAWAFVFVIYPFSAVIYPLNTLPDWARTISAFLPTSYIFENMRSVIFTGNFSSGNIIISFLLNIIYIILTLLFLNRMFTEALKNAKLVKLN